MGKIDVRKFMTGAGEAIKKHSPEILTGFGIAGMITTTVLAVRATPKAMMLIEEKKLDLDVEKLKPIEVVRTVWPLYVPSIVTGVVSTGCLIGANSVNVRRNAALATAYALSETSLKEYQEKVVETIGAKKTAEIHDAIAKDKVDKNPIDQDSVILTKHGDTLCLEPLSGRYFRSDIEKVRAAINETNRRLLNENYISLNEFYEVLGLEETKIGDDLGWQISHGLIDVHFSSQLTTEQEPVLVINLVKPPVYDYDRWM